MGQWLMEVFRHEESSLMKAMNDIVLGALALWEDHSRIIIGKVFSKYIHSLFYPFGNGVKILLRWKSVV